MVQKNEEVKSNRQEADDEDLSDMPPLEGDEEVKLKPEVTIAEKN